MAARASPNSPAVLGAGAALPASDRPVQFLPGVGPKLATLLADKLGLTVLSDLWFHLPLHYEDRTRLTPIGVAQPGAACVYEGVIEHAEVSFRGRRTLLAEMRDATGRIRLRFFYFQMAQVEKLNARPRVRVFGEARETALGFEIVHPKLT